MQYKKKQLAAISAVLALLNSEGEPSSFAERQIPQFSSPWSFYARQQTMQYRDITQRRIIKRSR